MRSGPPPQLQSRVVVFVVAPLAVRRAAPRCSPHRRVQRRAAPRCNPQRRAQRSAAPPWGLGIWCREQRAKAEDAARCSPRPLPRREPSCRTRAEKPARSRFELCEEERRRGREALEGRKPKG
nr:unnamed protein product [Digitaria exilis]